MRKFCRLRLMATVIKDLRKFLSLYDRLMPYLTTFQRTPVFITMIFKDGGPPWTRLELEVAILAEDLHQGKSLSHLNYLVDSFKTLRNYQY